MGSEGLRRNTQAREKQKAQEQRKFMVFECQKSCQYEMSLEREAGPGHSKLGGLLRSVDTIPGAMENCSREAHDQSSVFKSSHCLLLLRMDFRETKAELRSHSRNRLLQAEKDGVLTERAFRALTRDCDAEDMGITHGLWL